MFRLDDPPPGLAGHEFGTLQCYISYVVNVKHVFESESKLWLPNGPSG